MFRAVLSCISEGTKRKSLSGVFMILGKTGLGFEHGFYYYKNSPLFLSVKA